MRDMLGLPLKGTRQMPEPLLLAVLEVDYEQRVRCQAPGCGRAVYRHIHVVAFDGRILVYGQDCCERLFGWRKERPAQRFAQAHDRKLTAEERDQLVANTEAFLASLAERLERERLVGLSKLESLRSPVRFSQDRSSSLLRRPAHVAFVSRPAPPKPSPEVLAEALRRMRSRWDLDETQCLSAGWSSLLRDIVSEIHREKGR